MPVDQAMFFGIVLFCSCPSKESRRRSFAFAERCGEVRWLCENTERTN